MQKSIFRQESLERLKSPEQLNKYIKAVRPGIWLILAAAVLVLAGMVVWGIFGTAHSVLRSGMIVQDGTAVCFLKEDDAAKISEGMPVSSMGQTGYISGISSEPLKVGEGIVDQYIIDASGLEEESYCRIAEVDITGLDDGVYYADITVESIHPISFVIQ